MAKNNPEEPKKKKLSIKERLHLVFNSVSKKELKGVLADTLSDLRKPKEIGIFIVASVVPGGWIGYAAYRITKYKHKHHPSNDNAAEESEVKPVAKPDVSQAKPDVSQAKPAPKKKPPTPKP